MAKQPKKIKQPDDFDSPEAFIQFAVETFNNDVLADQHNIDAMIEDAQFVAGKQWGTEMEQARLDNGKPVLTINTAPAFVAQVVGNRLMNQTAIKVIPNHGGTKDVAEVRQGLIRSIEKDSRADRAYDNALQNAAIGGLGNFRVVLDYAGADVFEQEIKVDPIPNPAAVIWDHLSLEQTGRDAGHVFVQENMSRKAYDAAWPNYPADSFGMLGTDTYRNMLTSTSWIASDTVRVVSFWRMRTERRTIAMYQNGDICDVTDLALEEWLPRVATDHKTGEPIVREADRPYAQMYLLNGAHLLAGPYNLWLDRVPVFRVMGWEINVGEERHRFGIVRHAKDPMRLRNYWRSVIAEKLTQSPKGIWKAMKQAVIGLEHLWRDSHKSNETLLLWDGDAGAAPERVEPAQMEGALIQEAGMAGQDIKDVTNIHEASLGSPSNEVSGRAIQQRRAGAEIGTIIYQHNLNLAIEEAGRVINDLIPVTYDTVRTIKVLGEDGAASLQRINDPENEDSIDITVGKYSVTVITGPSYATKRQEAVETMLTMVNSMPEAMAIAADLIVENMDIPGSEQLATRLRKTLPPGMVEMSEMSEEQQQQLQAEQQAAQEQQQKQMQLQDATAQLTLKKLEAEISETLARADAAAAQAEESRARAARVPSEIDKNESQANKLDAEAGSTDLHDDLDAAKTLRELSQPPKTERKNDRPNAK